MPAERVLAVDPSLRGTGYAILESAHGKIRAITWGVVSVPPKLAAHFCLQEIHDTLSRTASQHEPTTFAIEGIIYVQNMRTAIILGSARGAALLVAARHGLDVHEPRGGPKKSGGIYDPCHARTDGDSPPGCRGCPCHWHDSLQPTSHRHPMKSPEIHWLGRLAYAPALQAQERAVQRRRSGEISDQLFLLEHDPVYTIGRQRDRSSLGPTPLPHPVVEINRGGQATFHGPGQLVGYCIFDLQNLTPDLHFFLRWIEESLICLLADYGLIAQRRSGLTGVWVDDRKIASIGVGVRRWVTMHGFGLNVGPDLSGYQAITPCGIDGVAMTSLSKELGHQVTVEDAAEKAGQIFSAAYESLRPKPAQS